MPVPPAIKAFERDNADVHVTLWACLFAGLFLLVFLFGWSISSPDTVYGVFLLLGGIASAYNFYSHYQEHDDIKREVEKFIEEFESQ